MIYYLVIFSALNIKKLPNTDLTENGSIIRQVRFFCDHYNSTCKMQHSLGKAQLPQLCTKLVKKITNFRHIFQSNLRNTPPEE